MNTHCEGLDYNMKCQECKTKIAMEALKEMKKSQDKLLKKYDKKFNKGVK